MMIPHGKRGRVKSTREREMMNDFRFLENYLKTFKVLQKVICLNVHRQCTYSQFIGLCVVFSSVQIDICSENCWLPQTATDSISNLQ